MYSIFNTKRIDYTPIKAPALVKRYYPALSSVVLLDDFSKSLGFIKQAIQQLFDKIHYKDLQYSKSPSGDAAFLIDYILFE